MLKPRPMLHLTATATATVRLTVKRHLVPRARLTMQKELRPKP
jgi:hypothetical protein